MIPDIEKATLQDIKAFQEEKLQQLLLYLNNHSAYYQELFKSHDISISSIKTIEDLVKIPVTTKDDLQQHNDAFLCV